MLLIKGNSSEIRALANGISNAWGIDVGKADEISLENIEKIAKEARVLAQKYQTRVLVTGKTDLVVTKDSYWVVDNGVESLSKIAGTGCMVAAMISSFVAVTAPVSATL